MMHDKCPQCGNKSLKRKEQVAVGRIVSVRTGKILKDDGFLETTCWEYLCKCGWISEMYTQ